METTTSGGLIAGVKFTFRGAERVLPPLNLDQVQEFQDDIKTVSKIGATGMSPEAVAAVKKIFVAALRRNYPDYTAEEAGKDVDLGNMLSVVRAVLGKSGANEEVAPGKP